MHRLAYVLAILAAAVMAHTAHADITYQLPDPAIRVTPNWSYTTTIVTMGDTTWRGPSHFYYVGECLRPDGPGYHCNLLQEDNVTLTADGHDPISVSLGIQSYGILIRSGHNFWRNADILLNGSVTFP